MILGIATVAVAAALSILNARGAYALTGSMPMAAVIASLAVAQWAAARQAMRVLVDGSIPYAGERRRWTTVAWLAGVYAACALLTVPLTAAELYRMMGVARDSQAARFDEEHATLSSRARELSTAYATVGTALNEYAIHARQMAELEFARGGSCQSSRGDGKGEIARFREQESRAASSLLAQAGAEISAAAMLASEIASVRIDDQVPVTTTQRQLRKHADELNRLRAGAVMATVRGFVTGAEETGRTIPIPRKGAVPELFACVDVGRTALLRSLLGGAERVEKLPVVVAPILMDAANEAEGAKAHLVWVWSSVMRALPGVDTQRLVEPQLAKRYSLGGSYALSENKVPLIVAWALDAVLLVLIGLQLAARRNARYFAERVALALFGQALAKVALSDTRPGRLAAQLMAAVRSVGDAGAQAVVVDAPARKAFHATWAERWAVLHHYHVCAGDKDLVIVPLADRQATAAARLAVLAGLAAPLSTALVPSDLHNVPEFEAVRRGDSAGSGALHVDAQHWAAYRVTSRELVEFLLQVSTRRAGPGEGRR